MKVHIKVWYMRDFGTVLFRFTSSKQLKDFLIKCRIFLWTKMEPLMRTKYLFTWLCMCSSNVPTTIRQKTAYIGVASTILALNIFCLGSNLIYFIKFVSTDLKEALFAFMTVYGNFAMLYTLINALRLRRKINGIFETLLVICGESKCSLIGLSLNGR